MIFKSPSAIRDHALPDPTSPHETSLNAVLRPIVFGANDGLVSNLALVMGVAGANPAPSVIVLAGVAGLIAGAFSMGVGEYISVRSQRELLEYQIAFQGKQLREVPEQERQILERAYVDRGFTPGQASMFVDAVFTDGDHAVRQLIFEEVGLDERSIGSPSTPRSAPSRPSLRVRSCRWCRTSCGPGRWHSPPACWRVSPHSRSWVSASAA